MAEYHSGFPRFSKKSIFVYLRIGDESEFCTFVYTDFGGKTPKYQASLTQAADGTQSYTNGGRSKRRRKSRKRRLTRVRF